MYMVIVIQTNLESKLLLPCIVIWCLLFGWSLVSKNKTRNLGEITFVELFGIFIGSPILNFLFRHLRVLINNLKDNLVAQKWGTYAYTCGFRILIGKLLLLIVFL